MEETAEKTNRDVDIFPLSKGKRIVAFLANFALLFIVSFGFFHLAFFPIASAATNLESSQTEYQEAMKQRDGVLYGNKILFYDEAKSDASPSSFSANLIYTCDRYLCYLTGNTTVNYDVFYNYYVGIKNDNEGYFALFELKDKATSFFDFSPALALKTKYVEEFSPYFEEGNSPSKQGEEDYSKFQKEFFLPTYSSLIEDVKKNDLSYQGVSYKNKQAIVDAYSYKSNLVVCLCAAGAYILSLLLLEIVVPLISKTRKTLGLIFLKEERVDSKKLLPLRRRRLPLAALYSLFFSAGFLFLLPWPVVSFNELFSLPVLWILSLISILLDLVSLIFLLIDKFDRSLSDLLTLTSYIDEESMDAIYRAKGYGE